VSTPDDQVTVRRRDVDTSTRERLAVARLDRGQRAGARDDLRKPALRIRGQVKDDAHGCVVVQAPDDALFPSMPSETVSRDHPDRVLPLADLAAAVTAAVRRLSEEAPMSENDGDEMTLETEYAALDAETLDRDAPPGESSVFACPACGGVLWALEDEDRLRFRCRVGHAYSAEGAMNAQGESVETALWTALRALQERAQLSERLAERVGAGGAKQSQARFEEFAREAREQAEVIRRLLAGNGSGSDG
jgi:two-component system chemotaxis response regulator CheB